MLSLPPEGGRKTVPVDPGETNVCEVTCTVPIRDVQQFWTPSHKLPFMERKWWIKERFSSCVNMPFVVYGNVAEKNVFALGADSLEYDNDFSSKINQEKGVYEIRLVVSAPEGETIRPFKVTLDRRGEKWTKVLADWRDNLGFAKGVYPEAAWKPVYCSWYAAHAAITQDWTELNAKVAAGLGFKTFILDDGWSYDEAKRVNPETIKTWYRDTGRWDAFSKMKFPDFKKHREYMRSLGLKYIVWTAPYFIGTRSPAYRKFADALKGQEPFEGNVLITPDRTEILEDVIVQFETLLKNADLDGLKIDFLDDFPKNGPRPLSTHAYRFVSKMMKRLKAIKPDGVYEFRQAYANPLTASLGTQFRCADVPFEWFANLGRICQVRLCVGDKVPVHADPMYWSGTETPENIDRHFLAAMAGVPMLSMELSTMPEAIKKRVKDWLDFYARHVEKFQCGGHWDVTYKNGGLAYVTSELDGEVFAIAVDGDSAAKISDFIGPRKALVVNLGYEPIDVAGKKVAPAGYARIRYDESTVADGVDFSKVRVKGVTDKDPVGYKVGEKMRFTIRAENLPRNGITETYRLKWERTGDDGVAEKGDDECARGRLRRHRRLPAAASRDRLPVHSEGREGGKEISGQGLLLRLRCRRERLQAEPGQGGSGPDRIRRERPRIHARQRRRLLPGVRAVDPDARSQLRLFAGAERTSGRFLLPRHGDAGGAGVRFRENARGVERPGPVRLRRQPVRTSGDLGGVARRRHHRGGGVHYLELRSRRLPGRTPSGAMAA